MRVYALNTRTVQMKRLGRVDGMTWEGTGSGRGVVGESRVTSHELLDFS